MDKLEFQQKKFAKRIIFLFFVLLSAVPVGTYLQYYQLFPATYQIELVFKSHSRIIPAAKFHNCQNFKKAEPNNKAFSTYQYVLNVMDNSVTTVFQLQENIFLSLKRNLIPRKYKICSDIEVEDYCLV